MDSLFSLSVNYYNMGLFRKGIQIIVEIENEVNRRHLVHLKNKWFPKIVREKLKIIANLPRFTLSEVDGLSRQARLSLEKNNSNETAKEFYESQVLCSLSRCYMSYGGDRNLKKAETILINELDRHNNLRLFSLLPRTVLYKTIADLYSRMGDNYYKEHFSTKAYMTAKESGLHHQSRKIDKEFSLSGFS